MVYMCSLYIYAIFFLKFNLYFCHTSYVLGTFIDTLPILTYSIFIIALYGRWYYYYLPSSPTLQMKNLKHKRLNNLIKFAPPNGGKPRIRTQTADCKVHVLNPHAMHCLKKYESLQRQEQFFVCFMM